MKLMTHVNEIHNLRCCTITLSRLDTAVMMPKSEMLSCFNPRGCVADWLVLYCFWILLGPHWLAAAL